jgi:hypothetical protein
MCLVELIKIIWLDLLIYLVKILHLPRLPDIDPLYGFAYVGTMMDLHGFSLVY